MAINLVDSLLAKAMIEAGFIQHSVFVNMFEGQGTTFWTDGKLYRESRSSKIWLEYNPQDKIRLVTVAPDGKVILQDFDNYLPDNF